MTQLNVGSVIFVRNETAGTDAGEELTVQVQGLFSTF